MLSMLITIYFWRFIWQINISLGNGLSPTGCQAIIWTNVDLDFCHHMAPTGNNESKIMSLKTNTFHHYSNLYAFSCFKHRWCPTQRVVPNNWLSPSSRWPFTGEFFQTLRHHLSICICYLGAKSNIVLFLSPGRTSQDFRRHRVAEGKRPSPSFRYDNN